MAGLNVSSPHIHGPNSVNRVMMQVVYALIPAIAAYVWLFGWGVVTNIVLAVVVTLVGEAVMVTIRRRPVIPTLKDGSALVTAILLAISLPPMSEWWLITVGALFAIVVAKHLYGGLGYNPFNPAMVGYVVLLISFPLEMTLWLPPIELRPEPIGLSETLSYVFTGSLPGALSLDTLTMATPLDAIKTQLGMNRTVGEAVAGSPMFGAVAAKGWEIVNGLILLGGLWLIFRRVITWHVPVGLLGSLFVISLLFFLGDPNTHPSPLFHIFSGGALLGAFFIATDPISGATSPRGRLYFGIGAGLIIFMIRSWGGYPDAVAFAVLLMNMAAPTIDYYTQPRVYGHSKEE